MARTWCKTPLVGLVRATIAAAVTIATIMVTALPAGAHTVSGSQPTNYKSEILSIAPAVDGLHMSLLDLGRQVRLTNDTRADVVVLGADGSPDTQVGPGGIVRAGHTARWRDKRTQGNGHTVGDWTIPMRAGGTSVVATGRITWVPGPSAVPWLLAALVIFLGTVATGWGRRWGPALGAALAVLVAVDAVHSFASAAATGDSVAATVGRVVGLGFISTSAWAGGVWAIARLQKGNEVGLLLAALSGFVIGLYSLSDTVILGRSQVAYVFPAVAARAAVALSLGIGFGLVAAVVLVFKRNPGLVTRATDT